MNCPASSDEILAAVIGFIGDEVLPKLDGKGRFDARIACSLLQILRREDDLGGRARAAERARLAELLDSREENLDALNAELCRRIADGSLLPADESLLAHLWATTRDRLAIDQPTYRHLRV